MNIARQWIEKLFGSLMEMYLKDQPAEFVSLYAS